VAQKHSEIGGRHMELLCIIADLARNDPGAVAQMYIAAQRMNVNTVGKKANWAEFLRNSHSSTTFSASRASVYLPKVLGDGCSRKFAERF
jgi:hypothetical protein